MKKHGDEVFAGTVNLRGAIEVKITKPSDQTLFQRLSVSFKVHKVKNHHHNYSSKSLKEHM